jgi:segregation and condensation protein B
MSCDNRPVAGQNIMVDQPASTNGVATEATPFMLLESLLFVASGPVAPARLGAALDISAAAVRELLSELDEEYQRRGIRLQWSGGQVQLTTAPEAAAAIERFLGLEVTTRLSQAALEVLAIVAYLQPATRPQIDQLRGVNSDGALRSLLSKGLVEEVGRMETPGRPILYGTTPEFLQSFGLGALADMPPLDEEEE